MTEYPHSDATLRDELLTIEEVAELLRMPLASLRYWRVLDTGPARLHHRAAAAVLAPGRHGLARRAARVHRPRSGLILHRHDDRRRLGRRSVLRRTDE
ncbi:hypothetical protein [Nocardioides sp. B-3]|uniref:hypothetical protein n=1 Tax=Nocardioides sp. B-3 TaxID=2895565 RepID=UPI00215370B6|nr:hypothetical protein [Nocardioides sp. B-3]UUZ58712.1 hypothetical protein LP418_21750 [Nocardioides sp. B-3]